MAMNRALSFGSYSSGGQCILLFFSCSSDFVVAPFVCMPVFSMVVGLSLPVVLDPVYFPSMCNQAVTSPIPERASTATI